MLCRRVLRKAVLVFGFIVVIEAFMPGIESGIWNDFSGRSDAAQKYVADVLKEKRTGLGAIEELKLAQVILEESIAHKIDPLFVLALIETESSYYNWTRSFKGAMGLMQIMPSTGRQLARELKLEWNGEGTLLDPYANVKMGIYYYSRLQKRFDDPHMSLAAYNVGPNYLAEKIRLGEEIQVEFPKRVLRNYKDLRERAGVY